jgi:tetratricopeptide (TPR) repeat protein
VEERLEAQIRKLQEFYWSDADPEGRGFVPLADMYRRVGDFLEARRLLREGLELHPGMVSGHVVLGWVLQDQGNTAEAEGSFRAALALDSKNLYSLKGLGAILLDRGESEEALGIFQDLLTLDPMDEEIPARAKELEESLEDAPSLEEVSGEEEGPQEEGREPDGAPWRDDEGTEVELDWEGAAVQEDESGYGAEEEPVAGEGPSAATEDLSDLESELASEPLHHTLATRTMGEIFLRQGLWDQAREVFHRLLERDPGSEAILSLLAEVDTRAQLGEGESVPVEALAPDLIVPIAELAPDSPEAVAVEDLAPDLTEAWPVEDLAPDPVPSEGLLEPVLVVPIGDLAPDVILPIEELAPDPAADSQPEDPTVEAFEAWLNNIQ